MVEQVQVTEVAEVLPKQKRKYKTDPDRPVLLGVKQLLAKRYKLLEGVSDEFKAVFGVMMEQLLIYIDGASFQGKSRFVMWLVKEITKVGNVIYISGEEGHRKTMQDNALANLDVELHSGKILFADHTMTPDRLKQYWRKKKSAKFAVIDSLQYSGMDLNDYKCLKEDFPSKGLIIISHADGKEPKGSVAKAIKYDVDAKVHVKGFVAEVKVRGQGVKFRIIWEEGAIGFWGRKKVNDFKKGKGRITN